MNNYEKIKQMTVDQFAKFLATKKPRACCLCSGQEMGCLRMIDCKQGIKQWLLQEVEE